MGKIDSDGYVRVKGGKSRRVHQVVMERMIGRPLRKGEIVHHLNLRRSDNREDNLIVCDDRREHNKIHKQLEELAIELYNKGIIRFDRYDKQYYFAGEVGLK